MIAKLEPHGDGVALVLDDELLRQLNATRTSEFSLTVIGERLMVEPVPPADAEVEEALDRANSRFGDALRNLAN